MEILENVSLSDFTTMRVGGPARFFCKVKNEKDLKEAVSFVKQKNIPFFVLGGGSNIVFSDEGFPGMIIKIELSGIVFREEKGKLLVTAGAGVVWDKLVEETVVRGLFGLENLSFIPGTVGSAPVQNIGAYGVEAKDLIVSVNTLDIETLKIKKFTNRECCFGYRESFFKTKKGAKYIVIEVTFAVSKKGTGNFSYGDLQKKFGSRKISEITSQEIRDSIIETRKEKLPYENNIGSAGSFFKNPVISKEQYTKLLKEYPTMPMFKTDNENKVKVPAGWLIDNVCGMKGITEGNVGTYKHQALVIVNYGGATAEEIKKFAEKIISCVKEKTDIELEREVVYVE